MESIYPDREVLRKILTGYVPGFIFASLAGYILCIDSRMITNGVLGVLAVYFYYKGMMAFQAVFQKNKIWIMILSTLYSFFSITGSRLTYFGDVDYRDFRYYLAILLLIPLYFIAVDFLLARLDSLKLKNHQYEKPLRAFFLSWLMILLGWLPVFLAAYPGYFCYDASTQIYEFIEMAINKHHPPAHTLLMGWIIENASNTLGSYNTGIAVFIIFQMLVISFAFAYVLYFLMKNKVNKVICGLFLSYYAFFPVIALFSMCSTKDSLFSTFVMLFVVLNFWQIKNPTPQNSIALPVVTVLMLLFRNNCVYAYAVYLLILFVFRWRKFWYNCFNFGIPLLIYFLITGPLYNYMGMDSGNPKEALSIPMQQAARISLYHSDAVTDEEKAMLEELFEQEIANIYLPRNADSVKIPFKTEVLKGNLSGYTKLYLRLGRKAPGAFLNGFLHNSLYAWYPNSIIDGYNRNVSSRYQYPDTTTSYFAAWVEEPGEAASKIPFLKDFYWQISREITFQRLPVISMLFSIGFIVWFWLFIMGYLLIKKRKEQVLPLLFLFLLVGTTVLGPVVLVRYYLYLFYLWPVGIALLLQTDIFHPS